MPQETIPSKERIKKLKNAYYVCVECGNKYGEASDGVTTFHKGICDVCGKEESLCGSRNYGYFRKTLITNQQKGA